MNVKTDAQMRACLTLQNKKELFFQHQLLHSCSMRQLRKKHTVLQLDIKLKYCQMSYVP